MPRGTWPAHDVGVTGAQALDFFFFSPVCFMLLHKEKWRRGVPGSHAPGERGGRHLPCGALPLSTFSLVYSLLILKYTITLGQNVNIHQVVSSIWQSGALSLKRCFNKSRAPLKSSVAYRLWPGPFWGQRWAGQNAFCLWTRILELGRLMPATCSGLCVVEAAGSERGAAAATSQ